MNPITEQALQELEQNLRTHFEERLDATLQDLGVQITEAYNRTVGITTEQVQELIREAVSGISEPTPGLTAADVDALIDTAVSDLPSPAPGLTEADVQQLIADALPEVALTREDIEAVVAELLPEDEPAHDPGVTREEVETMIKAAPRYDDEVIRRDLLQVKAHNNGLADHVGVPRMKG